MHARSLAAQAFSVRGTGQSVRTARLYVMRLAAPAVALVVQGLLLRVIGLGGLGTYAVLTTAIGLLAILGARGAPQALSRALAISPDPASGLARYRATNRAVLGSVSALALGFAVLGPFLLPLIRVEVHPGTIAVVSLTAIAVAAHAVYVGAARGLDRLTAATGVDLLLGRVLFAGFLLAAWAVTNRTSWTVGLSGALVGLFLTTSLGVGAGALWIWGRDLLGPGRPESQSANADQGRALPATNSVLLANQVVLFFAGAMSLWILHRAASPEQAGAYHLANRLALVAGIPGTVAQFILGPKMARAAETGNMPELRPVVRRHVTLAAGVTAGLAVAIFVGGPPLISALGGDRLTLSVTLPLLVLLAGQLIHVATGPCGYALIMAGEERRTLLATATGAVVVLGLGLLLIPRYPLIGAAGAVVAGIAVTNVMNLASLWRSQGLVTVVGR